MSDIRIITDEAEVDLQAIHYYQRIIITPEEWAEVWMRDNLYLTGLCAP